MEKPNYNKIGAVLIAIFFLGVALIIPSFSATSENNILKTNYNENPFQTLGPLDFEENTEHPVIGYEEIYIRPEDVSFAGEQNDINYNVDAGNRIQRSIPIYPGEQIDLGPGRGRTGSLDPDNGDNADYYRFTVCEGQTIQVSLSTAYDYDIQIFDIGGNEVGQSYTAESTGLHFIGIIANDGAIAGDYTLSISITNQNDANSGSDAGNTINNAISISPGTYSGYLDSNDHEDWYSFNVNSGQGIFITIDSPEKNDMDVHLYDPSEELVYSAQWYGDDELEYPADASGTWKIKIEAWPGWDTSKWPDDYYLYGSGGYIFDLIVGGSADAPVVPEPQPAITPVAQTFIVNNDPTSNKDEYGYLAAIPAANYIEGGERYLSPIVYQGEDFVPTWSTTVDETTQYFIDDWNTYLDRHDMVAEEFTLPSDPIEAASNIAISKWSSSDTVVLAVDGSSFEDEIETIVDTDDSLSSSPEVTSVQPDGFSDIIPNAKPMWIGKGYGAIHLIGKGDNFAGDTGLITPRYEAVMEDWWPFPYDANGEDKDTFYPVSMPGIWFPYVTDVSGLEELQIIKYPGNRYNIPVNSNDDCSIDVTISTSEESRLVVYLIDPEGNIRRPMVPHYNGGEIKPLHYWNGGHWQHDQDEFRTWKIEPHYDFSVNVHNAMEGTWTAIVVPFLDYETGTTGFNGNYHITINKRNYNSDRIDAALSAANGAVIASLEHAPLLYVTSDSVPSETANAISQLGASDIIFVNINGVSDASPSGSVTEYETMQEVINAIKSDGNSENLITMISLGTGEGYFAPAAMAAAYHGSPVLNVAEGSGKMAYNTLDMLTAWREYAGDYYHGCRSVGHLSQLAEPSELENPPSLLNLLIYYLTHDQEMPHAGLELKLTWFSAVNIGIHDLIDGYGLDRQGKEAYLFVGPRDTDIRDPMCRAMEGNESYAGHIPVETPAFASAIICRNILYPAVIYANPGRDVTTSQLMNFPDGYSWRANDGNEYPNFASQELKITFSSQGRFFEGHCIWDNLLERYNEGAAISYYSGHGTGGSGISAQYKNIEEQFPLAEPRYDHLKDFDWWDAWRGYSGYDDSQTKSVRWGDSAYNAQEPNLYDIIHFKWVDELFENLHSEIECWSSCTTGEHWGPMVYLSHGSAAWFGAVGSTYGVQDDLHNSWVFHDTMVEGKSIAKAWSDYEWIFNSDYTTLDPTTLYGRSTLFQLTQGGLTNVKVFFGDPELVCYSPNWIEPTPVTV